MTLGMVPPLPNFRFSSPDGEALLQSPDGYHAIITENPIFQDIHVAHNFSLFNHGDTIPWIANCVAL